MAPSGPNCELLHISEQFRPVTIRVRKMKVIGRGWLRWCIETVRVRSLSFFSRAGALAVVERGAPHAQRGEHFAIFSGKWESLGFRVLAISEKVGPGAGSPYPVTNSAPSQGARETRRESSPMLADGTHWNIRDDSRRIPRAFSLGHSRQQVTLMYMHQGGGA